LGLYLIELPLEFRALTSHGIVPYVNALPGILSSTHPWDATGRNLLIGYAVIAVTAFQGAALPLGDLLVAVNPLPGRLTGWYEIADLHRLHVFTPMPGLGELGNAGWLVALMGSFLFGAALGVIDLRSKR